MAWTVTELPTDGYDRSEGKGSATRRFQAIADTLAEANPYDASVASDQGGGVSIPADNSTFPKDSRLKLTTRGAERDDGNRRVFIVTVGYTEKDEDNENGTGSGETDEGLPTIRIGAVQRTEVTTVDRNGNPIVNSAGDPFEPAPEFEQGHGTITVSGTVDFDATLPAQVLRFLRRDRCVNQNPLFGFPAQSLKLSDADFKTRRTGENTVKWDVSLTWYEGDWRLRIIDNGIFQVGEPAWNADGFSPGADPEDVAQTVTAQGLAVVDRKRVLDADGVPVDRPVLLDGNGKPLEDGAAPVEIPFGIYGAADHSANANGLLGIVGLPDNLAQYAVTQN